MSQAPITSNIARPARAILSRFHLATKVLIVFALFALPLGIVLGDYVGQQSSQVSFADLEQAGVNFLAPADQLLVATVEAEQNALNGKVPPGTLANLVSSVDASASQYGTSLGIGSNWQALRTQISSVQSNSNLTPDQLFQEWSSAANSLVTLMANLADNSKLRDDPNVTTNFLADVATIQLPTYLVNQGLATGYGILGDKEIVNQGFAESTANVALQTLVDDVNKAASNSGSQAPILQLGPMAQALAKASAAADFNEVVQDTTSMNRAVVSELAGEMSSRISNLQYGELRNELIAGVMVLVGIWLLFGLLSHARNATSKLVTAMERVAQGDVTAEVDLGGQDEFGTVATHLNSAIGKVRSSLRVISERMDSVLESSEDLYAVSSEMSTSAESVSDKAATVSDASEQVNTNVTVVAAAIEEMAASVKEIALNASRAAEVATRGSEMATLAGQDISRLESSSVEISNVVSLITSIAEQTNLLALNATIEAARAGDMGKGFAVVANEVKDLAGKTTKATEDIALRIEAIQANTDSAAKSVTQIREIVEEINAIQASIASSVEEQAAAVSEVGRSVSEAANSTGAIVDNISGVAVSARDNKEMAGKNQISAKRVSLVSGELQELIGGLLGQFNFKDSEDQPNYN